MISRNAGVNVSFYGVRGSTPCHSSAMNRYGGNTSCVVVQRAGEAPFILDAGTGLRFYGLDLGAESFTGTMLLTHLHWDHVQGLPFFPQALHETSVAQVYGPPEEKMSFSDALCGFLRPPYFPVSLNHLPGQIDLDDLWNESVQIGDATVTARSVPHQGRTNGYRIEWPDFSVAYVPDHQQPEDASTVAPAVLELARDVDLLIHDSQFSPELLAVRSDWGHCTPDYAAHVAETAGASLLALFHHDPLHDDDAVDTMLDQLVSNQPNCNVVAAAEGLKLSF